MVTVLCFLSVADAGADSATIPSDQVTNEDTISIPIQDLKDNAVFTLQISGTFPGSLGGDFSFEANSLQTTIFLKCCVAQLEYVLISKNKNRGISISHSCQRTNDGDSRILILAIGAQTLQSLGNILPSNFSFGALVHK